MTTDTDRVANGTPAGGAALFQEPVPEGLRCTLCPHLCVIGENAEGLCRARGVRGGRIVCLTYGRPASVISDEIEKKPLFHFHPGTRALSLGCYGCNVLCVGCQNWQISHASARSETARLSELTPGDAVALARRHKLSGVAFTYNDPVVWIEYVRDVCAAFKEAGLYTAFITAGYMTEAAVDFIGPVVEAFKFDLKAATAEGWARLSKVKDPAPALAAAVRAQEKHGCHVEVVSNIVPGLNDDDASIRAMAGWVCSALGPETPWHVTRFLPEFELSYLPATPIKTLERAVLLGKGEGLRFVYVGNVPGHPGRGTVCPCCGRTVIDRDEQRARNLLVRDGRCGACGEDLNVVDGWE
jgi:pyruvate formate lyase activating enzyme